MFITSIPFATVYGLVKCRLGLRLRSACAASACVVVLLLVLAAGCLLQLPGYCVPACPGGARVKQPDGSAVTIFLRGDEKFHWNEDASGYQIVKSSKTDQWVYASESNGIVTPTRYVVGRDNPTALGLQRPVPGAMAPATTSRQRVLGAVGGTASLSTSTGTMKNLVLLVSFSDLPMAYSRQQFDDLFNEIGYTADGAVGSVKDFYHEVSYNSLTVQSTVVEAVTLDNGYAYYGANGLDGYDVRPQEMVAEALSMLEARGFDFTIVDGNGDGWVDGLTVIHAGGGEEYSGNDENYIWSHQWALNSPATYDGIKLQTYHTEPARRGWDSSPSTNGITRIGVICHETGHFLGLPDLYDYGYDSEGAGNFCLMAGGSWGGSYGNRPVHPSAWCKASLGWVTPTVISAAGIRSLSQIETNQQIYKIQGACSSNEYFLLENRQGVGFDQSLPGSSRGILIWHVDENQPDNDDQTHYHVDLEEASCSQDLAANASSGDDSDYFRMGNATDFTDLTCPNNFCYSGTPSGLNVENVSATGATMTFDLALPGCTPSSISVNPKDQTIMAGGNASFSVTASGTSLSYQWQVSTDGGSTYSPVTVGTGGTTVTYTTGATVIGDTGRRYRCVVSGACLPSATSASATLTVLPSNVLLSEDFEAPFVSGAPVGWTRILKTDAVDWVRTSGDHNGGTAAVGSYNALLYAGSSLDHETWLVTPSISFSSCNNSATLEFWHKQAFWSPDQDTLNVYYKTNVGEVWSLLASYASNVSTWTKRTLSLPSLSSTYYIGFLGDAKYGYGVGIDNVVVAQACCPPVSVAQIKAQPDSASVEFVGKTVTYAAPDYLYVEEDDRSSGIRVDKAAHGLAAGTRVDVTGTLQTSIDGERSIAADTLTSSGIGSVAPFTMTNRALGGGDWQYNSGTGDGQRGVEGGIGLNNIGLLVTTSGLVTHVGADYYYIDDGSRTDDGSRNIGVKVTSSGVNLPGIGDYHTVTGISSCYVRGGSLYRLIRACP